MSGPWVCARDDGAGVYVYDATDEGDDHTRPEGHPTELRAWEHALDCQLDNRAALSASIKECRRNLRRLKRKEAP